MWSWIKASGIAGSNIPYEIGEPCEHQVPGVWARHEGKSKQDGSQVSIYLFDAKANPKMLPIAKNALKRAKTLRHPNFLKLLDSFETEVSITMVTEYSVPLAEHILTQQPGATAKAHAQTNADSTSDQEPDPTLTMTPKQMQIECQWGLHQILKALVFLNNDAKTAHNSISPSTITVTRSGEWKLFGLDHCCGANDPEAAMFVRSVPEGITRYMAPEVQRKGLDSNAPAYVADMFSLGMVVWEVFHPSELGNTNISTEQMRKTTDMIPALKKITQRCLAATPSDRPDPARILKIGSSRGSIFANNLAVTCLFLEEIALKSQQEKAQFFQSMPFADGDFPPRFQKYKILPELVNSLMYGGAQSIHVLSIIIRIGKLLNAEEYQKIVIPCIVKLFSANDRATRMSLLQNLGEFSEYLSPVVVNEKVYPAIATGFQDVMPALRMESIKASLTLIPVLSEKSITTVLLKHFSALQVDKEPGIRVNTTICLGKMAEHFTESMRKKVLVHAFGRALKDPFFHGRVAGIKAYIATIEYYDPIEIAQRILPAMGLLTIDPEEAVRAQALKAISMLLNILTKNSANMPPSPSTVAPPPQPEQRNSSPGEGAVPVTAPTNDDGTAVSGWGTWAMSSLSKAMTRDAAKPEGTMTHAVPDSTEQSQNSSPNPDNPPPHRTNIPAIPQNTDNDSGNGWGDNGGESDIDDDDESWEPMTKNPNLNFSAQPTPARQQPSKVASSSRWESHTSAGGNFANSKPGADRLGMMGGAPGLDDLLGESFQQTNKANAFSSLGRSNQNTQPPQKIRAATTTNPNSKTANLGQSMGDWGEDDRGWDEGGGDDWGAPVKKAPSSKPVSRNGSSSSGKPTTANGSTIRAPGAKATAQADEWGNSGGWDEPDDWGADEKKKAAVAKQEERKRERERRQAEMKAKRANRQKEGLGAVKK